MSEERVTMLVPAKELLICNGGKFHSTPIDVASAIKGALKDVNFGPAVARQPGWSTTWPGRGDADVLGNRMKEIVEERRRLEAELAAAPAGEKVLALHPGVLLRYERALEELQAVLAAGAEAGDHRGAEALSALITSVTVARDENRPRGVNLVINGRLNAIRGEAAFPNGCAKMVAGARFVHSRHPNKTGDHPLGFVFILPQVKAR